nr:hypothetical protein [Tanacetum cinerariifolium]
MILRLEYTSRAVRDSPQGVLVVVYGLLYPHLTGHQIFNPFDVPIICYLRLSYGRCIFMARCTSPKILEVVVDEVFERNYPMTSIIRAVFQARSGDGGFLGWENHSGC